MKYRGVTGIGCYGRPETLSRVLKKLVETYILGNFKGFCRNQNPHCMQFETLKLLKALIGGLRENRQFSEPEIIENLERSGITGFFLALERRRLNLSVFTRHGQPIRSMNLGSFAEISEKRLQ